MDRVGNIVFQEVVVALLLGGASSTLIVFSYGYDELIGFLRSLNPVTEILLYFLALVGIACLAWFIESKLISRNVNNEGIYRLRIILHEVSSALLGTMRFMSGGLLVTVLPILFIEPTLKNVGYTSLAMLLAAGGLVACVLLFKIHKKIEPKLS